MKFLNLISLLVLLLIITLGCSQNYVSSIYPIPCKKLCRQEWDYKKKYGRISALNDTTIISKKLCRIYSGGILKKIGKINGNKPIGYWFIFDDSLDLEYIFKYSADKIDSFLHPYAIVNQRW